MLAKKEGVELEVAVVPRGTTLINGAKVALLRELNAVASEQGGSFSLSRARTVAALADAAVKLARAERELDELARLSDEELEAELEKIPAP